MISIHRDQALLAPGVTEQLPECCEYSDLAFSV